MLIGAFTEQVIIPSGRDITLMGRALMDGRGRDKRRERVERKEEEKRNRERIEWTEGGLEKENRRAGEVRGKGRRTTMVYYISAPSRLHNEDS